MGLGATARPAIPGITMAPTLATTATTRGRWPQSTTTSGGSATIVPVATPRVVEAADWASRRRNPSPSRHSPEWGRPVGSSRSRPAVEARCWPPRDWLLLLSPRRPGSRTVDRCVPAVRLRNRPSPRMQLLWIHVPPCSVIRSYRGSGQMPLDSSLETTGLTLVSSADSMRVQARPHDQTSDCGRLNRR
jgi:hypothetical protein